MIWFLLIMYLLIFPELVVASHTDHEQAPTPVGVGWEFTAADELSLQQGGFKLYRGLGNVCKQWFMEGASVTIVADVPAIARQADDFTIPDTFNGEVCYEATSYIQGFEFNPDPTLPPTPLFAESYRSVRIGFHRLAVPTWWGDTVKVD